MSVKWSWKGKFGELHYKDGISVNLYTGNCLGVEIFENFEDKSKYQFCGFWNDIEHLENMLGLNKKYKDNIYEEVEELILYVNKNSKWKIIADKFTKANIKVILLKDKNKEE